MAAMLSRPQCVNRLIEIKAYVTDYYMNSFLCDVVTHSHSLFYASLSKGHVCITPQIVCGRDNISTDLIQRWF